MAKAADPNPGIAVDSRGNPVVDPTQNVLDLVEAANRRQDDLRAAEREHIREMLDMRTTLGEQDSACAGEIAELRANYTIRIDDIHQKHADALRKAEAQRIDAIREVDVKAVQAAAEVQATAATALATNVAEAAVAMRAQVDAAAAQAATSLSAALEPIIKDIADLRQAQYEAQGQKSNVAETQARGTVSLAWVGAAIAGVTLILLMVGTVVALVS